MLSSGSIIYLALMWSQSFLVTFPMVLSSAHPSWQIWWNEDYCLLNVYLKTHLFLACDIIDYITIFKYNTSITCSGTLFPELGYPNNSVLVSLASLWRILSQVNIIQALFTSLM